MAGRAVVTTRLSSAPIKRASETIANIHQRREEFTIISFHLLAANHFMISVHYNAKNRMVPRLGKHLYGPTSQCSEVLSEVWHPMGARPHSKLHCTDTTLDR